MRVPAVLLLVAALALGSCGTEEEELLPTGEDALLLRQPKSAPVVVRGQVVSEGAPTVAYVSLHVGPPRELGDEVKVHDEVYTGSDGRFELRSDLAAGLRTLFFIYASYDLGYETDDYCAYIPLPLLRRENERWIDVKSGRRLPPLRIGSAVEGRHPLGDC
jgi:hypothetical protein